MDLKFSWMKIVCNFLFQVSLSIVNLAAKCLGIRLTKTDQDYHRPIVAAEIGDSVDMPLMKNQKIIKRRPNKKQISIHSFRPTLPTAKSKACSLQWCDRANKFIFHAMSGQVFTKQFNFLNYKSCLKTSGRYWKKLFNFLYTNLVKQNIFMAQ